MCAYRPAGHFFGRLALPWPSYAVCTYILSIKGQNVAGREGAGTARPPRRGRTGAGGGRKRAGVERVAVKSSNLVSVGYDSASRTLEIEFGGGSVYRYFRVPPEKHEGLMGASSHGKYFAARIKGVYRYTRVA